MSFAWRPLLRELLSYLLVALFVAVLGGVVWSSRHPESAILSELRRWPVVGPVAGNLQDRYLQPRAADTAVQGSGRPASVSTVGSESQRLVFDVVYEPREARPYLWVGEGTVLRREPSFEAEPVLVMDAMTNLFVEERRGDWVRLRHRRIEGWVVEPRAGSSEHHGRRPAPVLPLPPRPPDRALVERALASMSGEPRAFRLGDYLGRSDFEVEEIVAACQEPMASLRDFYREELGVEPVGEAAEMFLLFASESDYRAFSGGPMIGLGRAGPGFAATHGENRSAESVCSTLIHETAHLLNRCAIGPALPPWLGEGIAEYVQWRVSSEPSPTADHWEHAGGELPGLSTLIELDESAFQAQSGAALSYAASGLWIEYLLSQQELRSGFREFLSYLSTGGPWSEAPEAEMPDTERLSPSLGDDLLFFLGRDHERLDAGLRVWLWSRG